MRFVVLTSALVMLLSAGCARKAGDSAKLSVGLPPTKIPSQNSKVYGKGISAFSTASLRHVVINVTGSGISTPVLFTWDGHDSAGTPPSSFELTVTKGSDRLIQVLAVYQDDSSGGMTFSYGDAKKSLSAANETVDIVVTALGGSQQSVGGHIAGRYFTSPSGGPTGTVSMKFQPGLGKPEMLIEQSLIVNGWFQVFGLSNVALKYELDNKEVLFGGPVSLNSPIFDPNANSGAEWQRLVRAHMPVAVRVESDGSMKPEEAQMFVWGYFGNAAAKADASWTNRSVCKASVSGALTKMKVFHSTPAMWSAQDPLGATDHNNQGDTLPNEIALLDQANPQTDVHFLGGNYDGGACPISPLTASDEFTTYLKVDKELLNGNGNDRSAGFRGPFRLDASGNPFTATFTGNRTLTGTLLPGADAVIASFRLFKRVNADITYDMHIESPNCNSLPAGYVGAGTTTVSGVNFSLPSNISDADAATGVAAILCAVRADGLMYNTGLFLGKWVFPAANGGGNPGTSSAASKVKIVPHASPGNAVYNQSCVPVDVVGVDNAGNMAGFWDTNSGTPQITITTDSGTSSNMFYINESCSSSFYTGYVPYPISNPIRLWYKSYNSGPGSFNMMAYTQNLSAYAPQPMSYSDSPGYANYVRFFNNPSGSINAFQCYPLGMQTVYGSSSQTAARVNYGGPTTSALNSSSGNVKFYTTPDCGTSSQATSVSFGGSTGYEVTTAYRYFRYESSTSTNESIDVTPAWGGTASSQILTFSSANIIQPGTATAFKLDLPDYVGYNSCMPVRLSLVDANGRLKPAGVSLTVNVTSTSSRLQLFDSSGCYSTANTISFPADGLNASMTVYVRTLSAGPTTLTLSGTNGITSSRNLTVMPETASQAVVLWPGLTFTYGTTAQGTTLPLFVNKTYTAKVVSVGPSGSLINNYVSPGSTALAISGSAAIAITGQTPFTAASYGTATFTFQPLYATSFNLSSGYNVSQSWGLNLTSWYTNVYAMPTTPAYVSSYTSSTLLSTNICKPFLLQMDSDSPYISAIGTFKASYTAGTGGGSLVMSTPAISGASLYSDGTCTTPLSGGQTVVPAGDSTALVYLQAASPGTSASLTLNFSSPYTGAGPLNIASSLATDASTAGSHANYALIGGSSMLEGLCHGFALEAIDGSGLTVNATASVTLAAGSMQTYSDPACTTAISTLNFSGESTKKFYVRHSSVIGVAQQVMSIGWSDNLSHVGNSGSIYVLNYQPDP